MEGHRTRCWKALLGQYKLDTVEQCLSELASGNQMRRGYVPVDADEIRSALRPKSVTERNGPYFNLCWQTGWTSIRGRVICSPTRGPYRKGPIFYAHLIDRPYGLRELWVYWTKWLASRSCWKVQVWALLSESSTRRNGWRGKR